MPPPTINVSLCVFLFCFWFYTNTDWMRQCRNTSQNTRNIFHSVSTKNIFDITYFSLLTNIFRFLKMICKNNSQFCFPSPFRHRWKILEHLFKGCSVDTSSDSSRARWTLMSWPSAAAAEWFISQNCREPIPVVSSAIRLCRTTKQTSLYPNYIFP